VQKKHHGSVCSAGFPVENGYTVGFDAMDEGARYLYISVCGLYTHRRI
jgi:hypothetical protein